MSGTGLFGHAPYTVALDTRTTFRTPTAAAAASTRRVPSTFTRAMSASSGIGSTTPARCTTTSTPSSSGRRSVPAMSTRWNSSFVERRAGSRTSSATTRVDSGRGEQREQSLPDETGRAGDGDRRHVHTLAVWPTFLNPETRTRRLTTAPTTPTPPALPPFFGGSAAASTRTQLDFSQIDLEPGRAHAAVDRVR